ncbi:magnesium transporter [Gammaproteobacteria bacterium]|jgi:magnesium transporter|nr:magnesium transporter [Gammaproteobacteria bacterium]MDA9921453.1 magnesium transporter [Gammaproteobacteria bacterium]MDB2448393.1 magnesium transporter [Gammaproteobacteria bacterium]MDB2451706.1 magnesium transporter [Gammaproteobacteria bacterium]MDB2604465.1 magnesium transporter [Gammaproteobacteria bacterium]
MENFGEKNNLDQLLDNSSDLSNDEVRSLLNKLSSSEIAHALESSPPKQRKLFFSLLETNEEGDVLADLGEEIQQDLISSISNEELAEAVKELEPDETVDILQNLPEERMNTILSKMSFRDRKRIEIGLTYPENTAGGLLNTDVISVRPSHSIEVVINYLRDQKELPNNTDKIFVVNKEDEYVGELAIGKIITSRPKLSVREVMDTNANPIFVNQDDKEVATIFDRNDIISSAVIDESGKLIGRITIDDVLDVIKEDADQNFLGMAGVAEDTFAPPGRAARSRVFWLSMNLLTAFIASMTINIFKDVLDQIVYLAILMPIVASMGGVAATQTLTIVLRGLTLEQINSSNLQWLFKRELAVSILNGFVLSILVGLVTFFWFDELLLALLISLALVINLISAVIAGVFVPLILRSLNQDPAIAGSVVVTTVTDVIGFLSFLGLATIFLI